MQFSRQLQPLLSTHVLADQGLQFHRNLQLLLVVAMLLYLLCYAAPPAAAA